MRLDGDRKESTMAVAIRLRDAMNAHDLEAFLDCFHADYQSEQPVHPGRGFGGREQVRTNWSTIFRGVPDFTAELLGHCQDNGREWSEWRWTGTRVDGSVLDLAGVIVAGVRDGRIDWGRLYIEPVEAADEGIDAAVGKMAGKRSDT
ncbi:MAG TPA: nuclear transport factor 2 family protein [Acidimicrobiia bacterium]|nr:nuclear transport factor 2 family protein [Acidimicrobiia bacterium]